MAVKILLADDHTIMREGLRSILENELGMEVVAQADDGRAAVELARNLKPDLVIMDVSMPDLNGIEATRRILAAEPQIKVIALSMHADKRFVGEMLNAGVSGYLLKHSAMDELHQAIQTALAGKKYISPEIAGVVIDDYLLRMASAGGGASPAADQLTPREREVLQLIAEGKSTKEIAACLHVSVPTIDTHRQHIMDKLQIFSVADLTKYAIRTGLTSLDS